MQICIQDSGCSVHRRTKIFHANFGINRLNSLRARAASVKHKYYAKNTIKCYLKVPVFIVKSAHLENVTLFMSLTFLYQLMNEKIQNCQQKDTKKEREDGPKFGKIDLKCVFCPRCQKKTNLSPGFLTWVGRITGNANIFLVRPYEWDEDW